MWELLLTPIDSSRLHDVGPALSWHARFMVLSWGFLLPMGVIAARFFKVMPGQNFPYEIENPFWWLLHRCLQYSGLVFMGLAIGLTFLTTQEMSDSVLHRWLGWIMVTLVSVQFIAALAHGTKGGPREAGPGGNAFGDHYNMTQRRVLFEGVHKNLGYLLLLISLFSILTGLWISNALLWMWVGQIIWWVIMLSAFIWLQYLGRAIDTYQAIWGTDLLHPGNNRQPIGWGIRRGKFVPTAQSQSIRLRKKIAGSVRVNRADREER